MIKRLFSNNEDNFQLQVNAIMIGMVILALSALIIVITYNL